MSEKDIKKNTSTEASVVSGKIDFDKEAGDEIFFQLPIASFKGIPNHGGIKGTLVEKVWLQKPKDSKDEEIEDHDEDGVVIERAHKGLWPVYVVHLLHECDALENRVQVKIPAGRDVYLPATIMLEREIDKHLGFTPEDRKRGTDVGARGHEMTNFVLVQDGVIPRPGMRNIQKYRFKAQGTVKRMGKDLYALRQAEAAMLALAPAPVSANGFGRQTSSVAQGSVPIS